MKPLNSLLIKPAGPDCNMNCEYCFYLRKKALFPAKKSLRMSPEILEELMRQSMTQGEREITFGWQGGEPTLMGIPFFRKVVEFQKVYGRGQIVGNGLQTNGILIDRDWADFLRSNSFLVGISLDGPERFHNQYRIMKSGKGSWSRVVDSVKLMFDNDVELNVLSVVNDSTVNCPDEIYEFHKQLGFNYMQFIPVVESDIDDPGKAARFSVSPEKYGKFLCRLFDLWQNDFVDGIPEISIRYFDSVFYTYVGLISPECSLMKECGNYVVVEHNGDVYSCDFFVEPEWRLGNLMQGRLINMLNSPLQNRFGKKKAEVPENCKNCKWLKHCWGGCVKDRIRDPSDNGLNHFCESYKVFFEYADERLRIMAQNWKRRQQLSQIKDGEEYSGIVHKMKIGRNDPCPCGSGKKYKNCCGRF